jgi:putative transposase
MHDSVGMFPRLIRAKRARAQIKSITHSLRMQIGYRLDTEESAQNSIRETSQGVGDILRRLSECKGIEVVEGTLCVDHIHMCLAIPPKYTVSTIVGYLKGKSAMITFEKHSRLKKNYRGHRFWTRGYYFSRVGLDEGKIRAYMRNQEANESIENKYDSDLSDRF